MALVFRSQRFQWEMELADSQGIATSFISQATDLWKRMQERTIHDVGIFVITLT